MDTIIDFSPAKGFDPLEGTYDAILTEHKIQLANSGQPKASFTWTLTEPEVEGRKIWKDKSLQPQALWAVKPWYIAMGANAEVMAGPVDVVQLGNDLVGNACRLKLSIRQYTDPNTGETKNVQEVDRVLSEGF